MISPAIDLTSASGDVQLSFYMYAFGANVATLDVGVANDIAGPYTSVFSWTGQIQTTASESWTPVGVDLSAYAGQTVYLRFQQQADGSGFRGDLGIDLVEINACELTPTCPDPSDLAADNITINTASLNWTDNASASLWDVEYGTAGFTQGTGMLTSDVNATTLAISSLTPDSDYEFYVRADCGVVDGESDWVGPVSFSTLVADPVPCVGGFAGVYPCENYDLMSVLTIAEMGGAGGVEANDIWD